MRDFFRVAVFSRNVPAPERVLRAGMALALAALPFLRPISPWLAISIWGTATVVAFTGFLGFCPACYLAGRTLPSRKA